MYKQLNFLLKSKIYHDPGGLEKQSPPSLTYFEQGNTNTPFLAEVYRRDSYTSITCNLIHSRSVSVHLRSPRTAFKSIMYMSLKYHP